MIDVDGITYQFYKTAYLVKLANIEAYSVSRREYEESHVDATMANHRAVGYIGIAAGLEPYNPYVLWEQVFINELSGKSIEYMFKLSLKNLTKLKLCDIHGYGKSDELRKTHIRILKYVLKDYQKMIRKGKFYEGTKA